MKNLVALVVTAWAATAQADTAIYPMKIEVVQKPYGAGCLLESTIKPSKSRDLASVTVTGYWSDDEQTKVADFSAFFADLDQGGRRTVTGVALVDCYNLFQLVPRGECRKREGSFQECLIIPDVKRSPR